MLPLLIPVSRETGERRTRDWGEEEEERGAGQGHPNVTVVSQNSPSPCTAPDKCLLKRTSFSIKFIIEMFVEASVYDDGTNKSCFPPPVLNPMFRKKVTYYSYSTIRLQYTFLLL